MARHFSLAMHEDVVTDHRCAKDPCVTSNLSATADLGGAVNLGIRANMRLADDRSASAHRRLVLDPCGIRHLRGPENARAIGNLGALTDARGPEHLRLT